MLLLLWFPVFWQFSNKSGRQIDGRRKRQHIGQGLRLLDSCKTSKPGQQQQCWNKEQTAAHGGQHCRPQLVAGGLVEHLRYHAGREEQERSAVKLQCPGSDLNNRRIIPKQPDQIPSATENTKNPILETMLMAAIAASP